MTDPLKQDALRRLTKIAGQVNGIQRMIDHDRPCVEMLQQLSSVRAALEQVSVQFLSEHLQACVLKQGEAGDSACCEPLSPAEQSAEIKTALSRFLRHSQKS